MDNYEGWKGFVPGHWQNEINVRDFIQKNYTPYEGDDSFLAGISINTQKLWQEVLNYKNEETARGGVYDADTKIISTIISHGPGYIDKDIEKVVGIQTDKPFKRSLQPFGGIRMSESALKAYGYSLDPEVETIFSLYRKTHNQGFSMLTMKK